jgi:hypothetical protein
LQLPDDRWVERFSLFRCNGRSAQAGLENARMWPIVARFCSIKE